LALGLKRRGFAVEVFERRPDPRAKGAIGGRSINLALSDRGLEGLRAAGVVDDVERVAVSMPGRLMHAVDGATSFMPYGLQGEAIRSVSRGGLNLKLIELATAAGIPFHFDHAASGVDFDAGTVSFKVKGVDTGDAVVVNAGVIAGADGAFSAVRQPFMRLDRFDYSQDYLPHGYKELSIPPGPDGAFLLEKNALHIWPRSAFMLIALPNLDGSFTCTLFLGFEGTNGAKGTTPDDGFADLVDVGRARAFFQTHFADALALMPDFDQQWRENPVSSLCTVRCWPWVQGNTFLIGDASHAIVPFFGQGMNAGFEDCRVLFDLLDVAGDAPSPEGRVQTLRDVLGPWATARKENADAIAVLAKENFVEMRDRVGSKAFLFRKSVEAAFARACPEVVIPAYTMVTFRPQLGYAEALRRSKALDAVLDVLVENDDVAAYVGGDITREAAARAAFAEGAVSLS
jgi:kynurenine 3-monooxygenase